LGRDQEAQYRAAVRLRNDFEYRFHALNILHSAYTCQGIFNRGPRRRFQSACGMHSLMLFWRVRFRVLRAPAAVGMNATVQYLLWIELWVEAL
jgi:hypothetical protein